MTGVHLQRSTVTPEEYRDLRLALDLTQKQLADLLKMSPTSIAHREQGVRKPTHIEVLLLREMARKMKKTN